ncbi:MAG: DoxX family protein [Frankiales bacterium]|nr:DoxX family protein [Frankiales bacterium]
MSSPVRRLARPMIGAVYVYMGVNQLRNLAPVVAAAEGAGFPQPERAAQLHAGGNVVGGLALSTGRLPRLAALGLATNLAATTYLGHAFWSATPAEKEMQRMQFLKNLSMLGGLLVTAADTGGRESIPHAVGRVSSRAVRRAEKARGKAAKRAGQLQHQAGDKLSL